MVRHLEFRHAARQGVARSRSPTARSPTSARRWRSWSPTAATSPRTPPRWSRSTTTSSRSSPTCARPRPAPPVRRELNSNIVATYKVSFGDTDAAFAKAAHVFKQELWQHRGAAHPIEARGILAEIRAADGGITVWASTQKAHDLFQTLTTLLDIDESLRVATPDIGGGFGAKLCVYSEDIAVVAAAKLLQPLDQMDRGPPRAFHQCGAGARPVLVAGDRGRRRGARARHPRQAAARHRRLHAAGPQHPVQFGVDDERALRRSRRSTSTSPSR